MNDTSKALETSDLLIEPHRMYRKPPRVDWDIRDTVIHKYDRIGAKDPPPNRSLQGSQRLQHHSSRLLAAAATITENDLSSTSSWASGTSDTANPCKKQTAA